MKKLLGTIGCILISTLLLVLPASATTVATRHDQNFRVAVYMNVDATLRLADAEPRAGEFDKVSVKVYRNRPFVTDAQIGAAKPSYTSTSNADVAIGVALQPMPAIGEGDVAPTIFVARMPQSRFKVSLYAQSHRAFKLEK